MFQPGKTRALVVDADVPEMITFSVESGHDLRRSRRRITRVREDASPRSILPSALYRHRTSAKALSTDSFGSGRYRVPAYRLEASITSNCREVAGRMTDETAVSIDSSFGRPTRRICSPAATLRDGGLPDHFVRRPPRNRHLQHLVGANPLQRPPPPDRRARPPRSL